MISEIRNTRLGSSSYVFIKNCQAKGKYGNSSIFHMVQIGLNFAANGLSNCGSKQCLVLFGLAVMEMKYLWRKSANLGPLVYMTAYFFKFWYICRGVRGSVLSYRGSTSRYNPRPVILKCNVRRCTEAGLSYKCIRLLASPITSSYWPMVHILIPIDDDVLWK